MSEWLALPLVLCTYCAIPISGADVFINELVIIKTKNECQRQICALGKSKLETRFH